MRFVILVAVLLAVASAFSPSRTMGAKKMELSMNMDIRKALGVAAMGFALAAPIPAMADGAVSASTVYRSRNYYGARIVDLAKAADTGNFAAFEDKKSKNGFDLFVSSSNAQKSAITKERKAKETAIVANIYDAVKAKDASKLKAAYAEFIKVSDLKSDYKPGELGQTDSSGYSPTWGTDRQYIYQR